MAVASAEGVVIGSGAFGASVACHLAMQGQRDVVLLDKFGIASRTSPRAAGLTQQIRQNPEMTRLAMRSVEKTTRFAEETGEPMIYHQSGSAKMARSCADRRRDCLRTSTRSGYRATRCGRASGPHTIRSLRRCPWNVVHALRSPSRARSNPARLCKCGLATGRDIDAEYRGDRDRS